MLIIKIVIIDTILIPNTFYISGIMLVLLCVYF
jgi:hypothetical protein